MQDDLNIEQEEYTPGPDYGDNDVEVFATKSILDKAPLSDENTTEDNLEVDDETDQSSDENTTEDNLEVDDETDQSSKKLNDFERQKKKWQSKISNKEAELEYWKQQALKSSQTQSNTSESSNTYTSSATNTSNTVDDEAPIYDGDFETYTRKMAEFTVKKTIAEQQRVQTEQSNISAYQSRLNEYKKVALDFDEVLKDVENHPAAMNAAPEILSTVIDSEFGPQIAYYLAQNLDHTDKINKLSPQRRLIELGKIEAKIESETKSKTTKSTSTKVSNAPAPVKPNQGKPSSSSVKSLHTMTADEVADYLEQQERKNPKLRKR